MLCSRSCIRTIAVTADHTNAASTTRSFPHSLAVDFSSHPFPLIRTRRFRCPKSILISCNSSRTSRSSFLDHHNNDDFLEASLLLSETISHYHMWRQRFQPELQRKSRRPSIPLSVQEKTSRSYNNLSRQGFLQRFQNPTIFLKVSCDGDYILPIVVGKIAIEKLIGAEVEQESEDCPDQFQFVKDLVDRLDHEVIMVRITERVVSTYFAKLYISQPGESGIISLDARPSDAINVANRCKAPIYVSKQIVFTDAIRLGYGMGGVLKKKATYDVLLDSPLDGPDVVAQELSMMRSMHTAIKMERFKDAAIWRDKLANLRKSSHGS
ncbi:bifunctional nuclease 2 isoform X1 [Lotus japonicus]|uniref:bifunctional nuclease 2 isoform X1 n=1 Tax=Lotus japonicus TaxID=34305 RepID=UPI00258E793B|nr:bifunctional nuclease 2 isoform X1 [Lotus japonicus]